MDSDHFQRAEQLFHQAIALEPASRDQFIRDAAHGDTDLASRIDRMVRYAERTSATAGMLRESSDEDEGDRRLVGARAGQFHIGELLGKGGFGCVYRGEQHEPIQRSVAVKVLRAGMDSQRIIARFESERHALALMDHPNIARVLDAGRTSSEFGSRPYVAMELVHGAPITVYCDEHRLSTGARLELFLTVCLAVQHAHQKGIIHRDLKPSNILVSEPDGVATPKVIDFGIAKATQDATIGRAVTEAHQFLGTPQYMSPEQADMGVLGVDTRSDIYSLGVVLYELLTGSTPIAIEALRDVSHSQMQRMIREQAVERPSTRIMRGADRGTDISHRRGADLTSLHRRLRGDLDWITLKALDPDRDRRYSSAATFADDIRRHLQHQPVLAGPPSALYRMRKFVRRHRVGVAAAALVALAVIGGSIGTTLAMLRARDSADEARAVNQFMAEVLASARPDQRGAEVRLADVMRTASATASQRFAGHPALEAQVRHLLATIFLTLDMQKECTAEAKQAVALTQSIYGPGDRRTLDEKMLYLRTLLNSEYSREAEQVLGDVTPWIGRVAGPDDPLALEVQYLTGVVHLRRGRVDEAEAALRHVLQRTENAADDSLRIRTLDSLGWVLRSRLNHSREQDQAVIREMEPLAREMVECSVRRYGVDGIQTIRAHVGLADVMLRQGDAAGAAEICRAVLATSEERLGNCHTQRQIAREVLADATSRMGNAAEAADLTLQAIECIRTHGTPLGVAARINGALPHLDRGGRWAEGETLAHEYATLLQQMGGGHGDMPYNADLYIARFVSLQGRFDEAEALFRSLMKRENEADDDQSRARLHMFYGDQLLRRGLYDQAEQSLNAATERLDDIRLGGTLENPDDLILDYIALYQAWAKPDKVQEYQRLREEALQSLAPAE